MSSTNLYESQFEETAPSWFKGLDYAVAFGEDIAPEGPHTERESFGDVLLIQRLRDSLEIRVYKTKRIVEAAL